MRSEATRIYAREYQQALRAGHGRQAAQIAREAVKRATGLTLAPRSGQPLEGPAPRLSDAGVAPPKAVIVPPHILADAERIRHLSHPTITGHMMGDPLPGRSALDKAR